LHFSAALLNQSQLF